MLWNKLIGSRTVAAPGGWDISGASFVHSFGVAAQDASPRGMYISPDGRHMFVLGQTSDNVNQYLLSEFSPWDVSTAVFVRSFSVAAQEANPFDVFFKPDGTRMYVVGWGADTVFEYSLSDWNISTATFVRPFSIGAQEALPTGIFFDPLGAHMYTTGQAGDDVNQYFLTEAWNVSTANYVGAFADSRFMNPRGVYLRPDGSKMYVAGLDSDRVSSYILPSPWNISNAEFEDSFLFSTEDGLPVGLFFKDDGTRMYIVGDANDRINEYAL